MPKKPSAPAAPAAEITYSKLKKSGKWGIRSNVPLTEGQQVTVTLKSGETKTETVEKVVFANESEQVWIAAIRETRARRDSDEQPHDDDDADAGSYDGDDDLPY